MTKKARYSILTALAPLIIGLAGFNFRSADARHRGYPWALRGAGFDRLSLLPAPCPQPCPASRSGSCPAPAPVISCPAPAPVISCPAPAPVSHVRLRLQ